jgi:aminocarboxymuconate-semialdehyde decarboxylase
MAIDTHAHVLLPDLATEVRRRDAVGWETAQELEFLRQGSESLTVSADMVRERFARLTVLERRLADMDDSGVDIQLVSPSPSHYYPWADADLASWVAGEANEAVASLVGLAPSRLRGLGLAPLQHPDLMVEALDDAVLTHGLDGVEISSGAPGVELSDPRLDPFWARAEELEAIVFLHPFGCTLDERLAPYYLSNSVGQPTENAVALSHLIFSGVLDRYPGLRILAAHGGGYLPTHIGRADQAWRVRPESRTCERPPSSYLGQLWFDSLVHDPRVLQQLVAAAGAGRVVLGSDYPFDMGTDDPVAQVTGSGLDDETQHAILSGNARHLLARSSTAIAGHHRNGTSS